MNDDSPDPARLQAETLAPIANGRDSGHGGGLFPENREPAHDDAEAENAGTEAEADVDADAETETADVPPSEETVAQSLRMAEALLFASAEPLSAQELADRLPAGIDVPVLLEELGVLYRARGVNLVKLAGKWAFRTAADLSFLMERERMEQRKLSRAALETLAIVAYHQPVTRAEIEAIRGVTVSKGTLDVLMEVGWVKVRGRRQTPGRPVTYGTNEAFLEHFGLEAIGDLPGLEELKAAGLLDARMPTNISIPTPSDADEDEDAEDDEDLMEAVAADEDGEEEGFDWDSFGADVDAAIGEVVGVVGNDHDPAEAEQAGEDDGPADAGDLGDDGADGGEIEPGLANGHGPAGSVADGRQEGELSGDGGPDLPDEFDPAAEDDPDHDHRVG